MRITVQQLGLIGGICIIIAVLAVAAYFQFSYTAPQAETINPTGYTAKTLTQELASGGVFLKAAKLSSVPQSTGSPVQSTDSDLGKSDITKLD